MPCNGHVGPIQIIPNPSRPAHRCRSAHYSHWGSSHRNQPGIPGTDSHVDHPRKYGKFLETRNLRIPHESVDACPTSSPRRHLSQRRDIIPASVLPNAASILAATNGTEANDPQQNFPSHPTRAKYYKILSQPKKFLRISLALTRISDRTNFRISGFLQSPL